MRMMVSALDQMTRGCKGAMGLILSLMLSACAVNPATGEQQFTALMSPAQENQIGAQEHPKIMESYGGPFENRALESYVNDVGRRLAAGSERPEVTYRFFVLDTPTVNAFAMPGGYIYVTRGLMALVNSEAELAAVLAHEMGHITARHSAERYSHSVLVGLGAAAVSAAVDQNSVTQAARIGSDLYIKSYSRTQEFQADELSVRYLSRAGYDPAAVVGVLAALEAQTKLEQSLGGQGDHAPVFNYFSTHPQTADRVVRAQAVVAAAPSAPDRGEERYLTKIAGLTYGDGARQGFVRGRDFIHPDLGLGLTFPEGFRIVNQPDQVIALRKDGAAVVLDAAAGGGVDPLTYLTQIWMPKAGIMDAEPIDVNGKISATGSFGGRVNGVSSTIRAVAISWPKGAMIRLQMAIPRGSEEGLETAMKRMTYSLHPLTVSERVSAKPRAIHLVTAKTGDTVQNLSDQMQMEGDIPPEQLFRMLNGLTGTDLLTPGRIYKIVW